MAFIVKKKIKGREYYYLNENKRVDGKVKTKTIAYLGKIRKDAEKKMRKILEERISEKETEKTKISIEEKKISIEELAQFCKAKGFVFRSSDIYGGFSGFWDFGPLGVELFNNIKKEWWKYFVQERENMVGMEGSIISHPLIWKASGHITGFKDVAVVCKKCKKSTKLELNEFGKVKCDCGGEYEKIGVFDMLFKTNVGALDKTDAYLRGETAQTMFTDFKLIHQTSRMQLPFGVAQIGRCFRNEIAPRDFLFRSREFHIAELEFFINPDEEKCNILEEKHLNLKLKLLDAETQKKDKETLNETTIGKMLNENLFGEWHAYWLAEQIMWFKSLGLEEIKVREHTKDELSHYSSANFDIDYEYSFGSREIAGIANRGQFDLNQHQKESKENLEIFDEKTGKKVLPKVIEPTFGMERVFLAILTKAYTYDKKRGNIVLKIPPKLSPLKAAIFPVVRNNKKLVKIAKEIYEDLKVEWNVIYDSRGSIGRRYARQDEIGTPVTITIDEQSLKDRTITVRDRNTAEQIRVKISGLKNVLRKIVGEGKDLLKLGKIVNTRKK